MFLTDPPFNICAAVDKEKAYADIEAHNIAVIGNIPTIF